MNFRKIPALICLTTGAVLSFSSSTYAITFTRSSTLRPDVTPVVAGNGDSAATGGSGAPANATTITDFNSGVFPVGGNATFSGGGTIRNSTQTAGGLTGNGYAPANDTSNFLITGSYYDQGNTSFNATGNTLSGIPVAQAAVTITFTRPVNYFGLYWGLVNATNEITFRNTLGTALSITNPNVGTSVTGNELGFTAANQSTYVNFFAASDNATDSIKSVILRDTSAVPGNGFEVDNIAAREAVPEPLTILGSGMALGFGALMKRQHSRKHQKV